MKPVGVGVVGCGNIAPIYLKNLKSFTETEVVTITDLDPDKAKARASEFGVPFVGSLGELLADDRVEIVLNLTTPASHHSVAMESLQAGKSVYNEKPLSIDVHEADDLLSLASANGLLVGCAPDTVLGAGIQTCRELIDSGAIGQPLSFQAFMMGPGHESWHPDPEFYYDIGGGPLFDMGPYYVSALVTLLGPVARVCGAARRTFETRTITSMPKAGQEFHVKVPTHLVTVMEFVSGAVGQLTTSFDVQFHSLPHIEIYGSRGTLRVPDPNGFGGPVIIKTLGDKDWREVTISRPYSENSRGLGVRELAIALRTGSSVRTNGELARHVLAVFHAAHAAPHQGAYVEIEAVPRPMAFPTP